MTLTDAGPLIAIIDADEADHDDCLAALDQLELPLLTTWPAFTEAMYLVARAGGIVGQRALWKLVRTGRLVIAELSPTAVDRSARLMDQYADTPIDLADASLVALAEEVGQRRIFTLDTDFQIYRLRGRQRFDVVPVPRGR
jgi:predicted nucleic acid-binding protein